MSIFSKFCAPSFLRALERAAGEAHGGKRQRRGGEGIALVMGLSEAAASAGNASAARPSVRVSINAASAEKLVTRKSRRRSTGKSRGGRRGGGVHGRQGWRKDEG